MLHLMKFFIFFKFLFVFTWWTICNNLSYCISFLIFFSFLCLFQFQFLSLSNLHVIFYDCWNQFRLSRMITPLNDHQARFHKFKTNQIWLFLLNRTPLDLKIIVENDCGWIDNILLNNALNFSQMTQRLHLSIQAIIHRKQPYYIPFWIHLRSLNQSLNSILLLLILTSFLLINDSFNNQNAFFDSFNNSK